MHIIILLSLVVFVLGILSKGRNNLGGDGMNENRNEKCIFCGSESKVIQHNFDYYEVDCAECGLYYIGFASKEYIERDIKEYPDVQKILIAKELKRIKDNSESLIGIMHDNCPDIANLDRNIKRWKFRDLRRHIEARRIKH